MMNDYYSIKLNVNVITVDLYVELAEVFGQPVERWFIFNGRLYIKYSKDVTWAILKYSLEEDRY